MGIEDTLLHFEEQLGQFKQLGELAEANRETLVRKVIDSQRLVRKYAEFDVDCLIRNFLEFELLIRKLYDQGVDLSQREAIGKIAVMLPYNSPALTFSLAYVGARLHGNHLEIKPSKDSDEGLNLFFKELTRLAQERGLDHLLRNPDGSNIISTQSGAEFLYRHLDPNSNTSIVQIFGSDQFITEYGIQRRVMDNGNVRVILEGPGNMRFIVTDQVSDLEKVAQTAIEVKILNSGQTCYGAELYDIHAAVYEPLLKQMVSQAKKVRVGDPYSKETDIGPIRKDVAQRIKDQIIDALQKGAKIVFATENVDGDPKKRFYESDPNDGLIFPDYEPGSNYCYVPLIILKDTTPDMLVRQQESFGPVIATRSYSDKGELLKEIRYSKHRLGATLFGDNIDSEYSGLKEWLESNVGLLTINQSPFVKGGFDHLLTPWGGYGWSRVSLEPNPETRDRRKIDGVKLMETGPSYICMDFSRAKT